MDRAVLADAAKVVARQVDEHHVLRALLLIRQEGLRQLLVLVDGRSTRAGSGDRALDYLAARNGYEHLGRGARDLEVLEVEEIHVRARVHRPQPAIDRERLDRGVRAPALTGHHLVDVACADVVLGDFDAARVTPAPAVRPPLGRIAWLAPNARHGGAQALTHIGDGG